MRGLAVPDQIVLAQESEFSLGGLQVRPSKRQVIAGETREMLQPRVMQVLIALARRRGQVVSRDELIAACWGGYVVSDDAIHRCIARLRRLSEAHGGFQLETVPRVGYQITEIAQATAGAPVAMVLSLQGAGRMAMLLVTAAAGVLVIAAGFIAAH